MKNHYSDEDIADLHSVITTLSCQVTALLTVARTLIATHPDRERVAQILEEKQFHIAALSSGELVPDEVIDRTEEEISLMIRIARQS